MSELLKAMEYRMKQIVFEYNRPFSVSDFISFEVDGKEYSMTAGTFRNNLVDLRKNGIVVLAFRADKAYYTLKGKEFAKPMMTSTNREVVSTVSSVSSPSSIDFTAAIQGREDGITPIYKWIEPLTPKKQSLHDIRLKFEAKGVWDRFSQLYPELINSTSKDIALEKWKFFTDDIEVTVTIHHTDIVSIALACSYKPIAIDVPDLFHLIEVLTRSEARLSAIAAESSVPSTYSDNNNSNIAVPRYTTFFMLHSPIKQTFLELNSPKKQKQTLVTLHSPIEQTLVKLDSPIEQTLMELDSPIKQTLVELHSPIKRTFIELYSPIKQTLVKLNF
jgi:hypothetical protein